MAAREGGGGDERRGGVELGERNLVVTCHIPYVHHYPSHQPVWLKCYLYTCLVLNPCVNTK